MMELLYQPQLFIGPIRYENTPYSALRLKMMCTYLFTFTFIFIYIFESYLPIVTGLVTYLSPSSIKLILKIKALYSYKMETIPSRNRIPFSGVLSPVGFSRP